MVVIKLLGVAGARDFLPRAGLIRQKSYAGFNCWRLPLSTQFGPDWQCGPGINVVPGLDPAESWGLGFAFLGSFILWGAI